MQGFETFHTPAASAEPGEGEHRGLITLVSLDLLVDRSHPKRFLSMGPDTETLSVRVYTSEGWHIVNNIYTHQKAKPASLVLNTSGKKTITVGDFNSRHEDWEPTTRNSPSDGMGNKLHSLIQTSQNIVLANTPRVPTTLSETTLTLSLVSPDIAPVTGWEVLLDCSSQPHFATLTSIQLGPPEKVPEFIPHFIEEKADWKLFRSITEQSDKPIESNINLKLSSILTEIDEAKHKAIPVTKSHDKVKPWECWWFDEECKEAKKNYTRQPNKTLARYQDLGPI